MIKCLAKRSYRWSTACSARETTPTFDFIQRLFFFFVYFRVSPFCPSPIFAQWQGKLCMDPQLLSSGARVLLIYSVWFIVTVFFGTKFDLPYNIRFKPLQGQRWIPPTQIFKTAHQLPCGKKILLSFRATSCEMTRVKVGIVAWQQVKADSFLSADVHLGGLPCVGS